MQNQQKKLNKKFLKIYAPQKPFQPMLLSTSTSHVEKFSIFYSSSSVIPSYLFLFVFSLFYLSTTETHTLECYDKKERNNNL